MGAFRKSGFGNSNANPNKNWVYEIVNNTTKTILKSGGQTQSPLDSRGVPTRIAEQISEFQKKYPGDEIRWRLVDVVEEGPNAAGLARKIERDINQMWKEMNGSWRGTKGSR